MRINANIASLTAYNNLTNANKKINTSSQRLSGGLRINASHDDPAGLAISRKMKAQIGGAQEANKNSSNGISLTQTADGGLAEIHNMLQRQRELTLQALNASTSDSDIEKIHAEINQISEEITGLATKTEYNIINLLARKSYSLVSLENSFTQVDFTTLGTKPINSDGSFNFTATTPDGSKVSDLIYSPANPSGYSTPAIKIRNSSGIEVEEKIWSLSSSPINRRYSK